MARSKYSLLHKKEIKVKRREGSSHDPITGYPVEPSVSYFTIKGHYYPLDDYVRTLLPESIRSRGSKRLHTPIEYRLRTLEEGAVRPDQVELNGVWYEIYNREEFDMGVLDHYEYLLLKLETSGGASNVTH